ncbi:MAG: hypothetical protein J6Q84_01710 [Kiritimatiellae bacterium]|nr:hypothetical protein [Kiritimatiellia bacterium]
MKDWLIGRIFMDEAGSEGGGGTPQPTGGEGGDGGAEGGEGSVEEKPNALADELNSSEGGEKTNPDGEGEGKSNEKPSESSGKADETSEKPKEGELTSEEAKAYNDAIKLDEKIYGKTDFDPFYRKEMPAFFKRHGIDPEKANQMANEFAAMQKKASETQLEEMKKAHEARMAEFEKMNEAYYRDFDKPARDTISRAVKHFVTKDSALWHTLVKTEVGVDKELLTMLHFVGERLPKDNVRNGSGAAGAGETKSLSDSFMGV